MENQRIATYLEFYNEFIYKQKRFRIKVSKRTGIKLDLVFWLNIIK